MLRLSSQLSNYDGLQKIFPIVPLQRLNEKPERRAILHDLTCDSDGRIDLYVDQHGIENTLALHDIKAGEKYLLGFFMIKSIPMRTKY